MLFCSEHNIPQSASTASIYFPSKVNFRFFQLPFTTHNTVMSMVIHHSSISARISLGHLLAGSYGLCVLQYNEHCQSTFHACLPVIHQILISPHSHTHLALFLVWAYVIGIKGCHLFIKLPCYWVPLGFFNLLMQKFLISYKLIVSF